MMYKLAFIMATGESPRLWLCDSKHGARSVMLNGHDVDEFIAALLCEGWEPFGIGTDNAIWFRKLERVSESTGQMLPTRPTLADVLAGVSTRGNVMRPVSDDL